MPIPVYQSAEGVFCEPALAALVKEAGLPALVAPPADGGPVRHVADLVLAKVEDAAVYLVELSATPEGADAPTAARLLVDTETLAKADPATEERYILSLVLEPNDGSEGAPLAPDTQNDVYSASEIRKTAHGWMEKGGQVDLMHDWQPLGPQRVRVLESYIAPAEFKLGAYTIRKGSWLLGLRVIDDNLWTNIKSGKIGAFSVGGTAIRKPVEGAPK